MLNIILIIGYILTTIIIRAGAAKFARKNGFSHVDTDNLVTPAAKIELENFKKYSTAVSELFNKDSPNEAKSADLEPTQSGHDTVGCVAIDDLGNISAGTSTGGITAKMSGRVGDSPIIGAGAYCDSLFAGVSTTGHGESLLRANLASDVVYRMRYSGGANELVFEGGVVKDAPQKVLQGEAKRALDSALVDMFVLTKGGRGGAIMIDSRGDCHHSCTTGKMVWASVKNGKLESGIRKEGPELSPNSKL